MLLAQVFKAVVIEASGHRAVRHMHLYPHEIRLCSKQAQRLWEVSAFPVL